MTQTKIACAQLDFQIGDVQANRAKVIDYIQRAAGQSVKLVIFPECALTGYCYESMAEAAPAAEPASGPSCEAIADACSQSNLYAVYGYIEKDGDTYYNAARLIGPDGPIGNYRKVHLPFLGVDRFLAPGDRPFEVFDLPFGRVGINICYDASFPESARSLKLLGADLIILPTNWPTGAWRTAEFLVNARANENHVNFVAVDRVGTERGWLFIGKSKIIDFNGDTVAEAGADSEELLVADLDVVGAARNKVINVPGKYEMDRIADRRPEFYGALTESVARKASSAQEPG